MQSYRSTRMTIPGDDELLISMPTGNLWCQNSLKHTLHGNTSCLIGHLLIHQVHVVKMNMTLTLRSLISTHFHHLFISNVLKTWRHLKLLFWVGTWGHLQYPWLWLCLYKALFSVEAFTKVLCDLYNINPLSFVLCFILITVPQIPFCRWYCLALSDTFNIYLVILWNIDKQVTQVLSRDTPNWCDSMPAHSVVMK